MFQEWQLGWKAGACQSTKLSSRPCALKQIPAVKLISSDGEAGVDKASNRRDPIGRETASACMFAYGFLIGCQVDTVDFIARYVAV